MDPDDPPDPLSDLRDRLRATQEAAARLAGDAPRIPPQGWASPGSGAEGAPADPGLSDELHAARHGDRVAARARAAGAPAAGDGPDPSGPRSSSGRILDRWIERLEPARGGEPDVEDIPIS